MICEFGLKYALELLKTHQCSSFVLLQISISAQIDIFQPKKLPNVFLNSFLPKKVADCFSIRDFLGLKSTVEVH